MNTEAWRRRGLSESMKRDKNKRSIISFLENKQRTYEYPQENSRKKGPQQETTKLRQREKEWILVTFQSDLETNRGFIRI